MGRKSREKRERRERGDGPVAQLIDAYSTPELLVVLDAASVSPTAAHRLPTLSVLFDAAIRRRRPGAGELAVGDLASLVNSVATVVPGLVAMEDCEPYDGRLEVLVPWNGALFRVLPGSMERPTQVFRQQQMLASVIDPVIRLTLGFGLADVGELVLRRMGQVADALAGVWPTCPLAGISDDATVTDAEVAAVAALPPIGALVDECRDPQAAARALNRYTVTPRALRGEPLSMLLSTFGTTIAIDSGGGLQLALPSGLLAEVLPAIAVDLTNVAMRVEPGVEQRWHHEVGDHIGHRLQGTAHRIAGPVRVAGGSEIHSLVFFGSRRVLAIGNCAALTAAKKDELIVSGSARLRRIQPGVSVRTPTGKVTIPGDAEVLYLQVTAGPMFSGVERRVLPTFGIDDLEWILHTERADREDLWFFVRDLTKTPGVEKTMAWDVIDQWEAWRPRKTFYAGAETLNLMSFAAHSAVAEWEAAAAASSAELALHRLGLRSLWDWPGADLRGTRGLEVADFTSDQVIQVLPWDIPVAIDRTDAGAPRHVADTLWRLSVGLDWKLGHCRGTFVDAAKRSGLNGVHITFKFLDRDDGPGLTVEQSGSPGALTIGWDSRLQMLLAENSFALEAQLGRVVSELVAPPHRDALLAAWDSAPPGIRIDGLTVPQRAHGLPEPIATHETLRADVRRDLARFLRDAGCDAGSYRGAAATSLESGRVFPWLIERFHRTVRRFEPESLLIFAMAQLECVSHARFMADKRLAWDHGFPVKGDAATDDRRNEVIRVTKVISLIVEEVFARPPAGAAIVDSSSWAEILAVAELCIESCFRSDAIHWRLRDVAVELSDLFEINVHESGKPIDFDMASYSVARAAATMPRPVPIATDQHIVPEADPGEAVPRSFVEQVPKLVPIDAAMRATLGFGLDAMTGVLNVATQWDATTPQPVTRTGVESIVASCVELVEGASPEEYMAALNWMTLRSEDLQLETIPHWETDRRAHRITARPFVDAGPGHVWVLPWTTDTFIRILVNYLEDGRLPWPPTSLPAEVVGALNNYRQRQNEELEVIVGDALDGHGFTVRNSVKPEKKQHYGLVSLSGEIDTVCIDAGRSRIWVIEAKDPTVPFSSRNIRRMVDDFHKPGGYVDKLLRKVVDVERSAASVASALGVSNPARSWTVFPLAVTRRVDPAAFALDSRIPFCVSDDVLAIVDNDDLPGPGFHEAM